MTSRPLKNSFRICYITFNQLSIALNILARIRNISFKLQLVNYSYWHVSLFKEFNDKIDKFVNVCWIGMFNVECIVWPSILNVILLVDAISNVLIFVKFNDRSLLYSHIKPWIINFKPKVLLVRTLHIKNLCIGILGYIFFPYMILSNINFFLHLIV